MNTVIHIVVFTDFTQDLQYNLSISLFKMYVCVYINVDMTRFLFLFFNCLIAKNMLEFNQQNTGRKIKKNSNCYSVIGRHL